MHNVIELDLFERGGSMNKRINQDLSEGLDGDLWQKILADLRGHMFAYGTWEKLSVATGLSPSTIQKLACGDTKSPHFMTVFKVMTAVGKGDALLQIFASRKPLTLQEAQKLKEKKKS